MKVRRGCSIFGRPKPARPSGRGHGLVEPVAKAKSIRPLPSRVKDALGEALQIELRCPGETAARLAGLARRRVPQIVGTSEDSDADLVMRLRDPRVFGEFAVALMPSADLSVKTRVLLADHAFDLMPLPRTESDVILVEARAPARLLALTSFLIREDAFTALHLLHLVYAVFLDRALVTNVEPAVRSGVLRRVLMEQEFGESLRALYACMHLAAVPEREAQAEFRRFLESRTVPAPFKRLLCSIATEEDGGMESLARLAEDEGLLSEADEGSPGVIVNIPRLPVRLAELGRKWAGLRGPTSR